MNDDVLSAVDRGLATLTLSPDKLNALRFETVAQLTQRLREAEADRSVGVVAIRHWQGVLGGRRPGGAFGIDGRRHAALARRPERARTADAAVGQADRRRGERLLHWRRQRAEPVLRPDDRLRPGAVWPGRPAGRLSPGLGATQLLPRLVGDKRAREIIFLCRQYTAAEALQMGWINAVVPHEELLAEVRRWADEMLQMSPAALRAAKQAWADDDQQLAASLERGGRLLTELWSSDEGKEGMAAFVAKRPPDFGRFR